MAFAVTTIASSEDELVELNFALHGIYILSRCLASISDAQVLV